MTPFRALAVSACIFVSAFACGPTSPAAARAESKASAAEHQAEVLPGSYTCQFEIGESPVDGASCTITGGPGAMQLSMAGGDHKLTGSLSPTDAGFRFIGDYTCGSENCNEHFETDFFEQQPGTYHGMVALQSGTILNVTMVRQ